jgi:outer membrane protein, multidrug efflux system
MRAVSIQSQLGYHRFTAVHPGFSAVRPTMLVPTLPGSHTDGMGNAKFLLVATALLVTGGCALTPAYTRPEVQPTTKASNVTEGGGAPAASDLGWHDFIQEPRLQALMDIALTNNKDLKTAVLNLELSRQQLRISSADLLPQISASATHGNTRASGVSSESWNVSGGVTGYELDIFGRLRAQRSQATESLLATDEARRAVQISLVAEVASQYFQLRSSEEQIALAGETLAAVQRSFAVGQARFDAGATGELDLRTAETQVLRATASLNAYERQRLQIENALGILLGVSVPDDLSAAAPLEASAVLADISAGLQSELLLRRPDVAQSEHRLKAAYAGVGIAKAAYFPSIRLTGTLGSASPELGDLLTSGTWITTLSQQLAQSLFTGGKIRANVEVAKIRIELESLTYQKTVQNAFREVSDALNAVESYRRDIDLQARLIAAQSRRFELATQRYEAGEDGYLNVLTGQQELYSAQQAVLDARYNAIRAQISLYKALGGGWK